MAEGDGDDGSQVPRLLQNLLVIALVLVVLRLFRVPVSIAGSLALTVVVWVILGFIRRGR